MKLVSRQKLLKGCGIFVLLVLVALGVFAFVARDPIQRIFLGGLKVYETTPPAVPADLPRPAILVFSKTNGFRHEEAIPVANALFARFAADNGWGYFATENGATFSPELLARFDAVVFNNVSGDVFTPDQRQALRDFVERGGGFVAFHGSGGDNEYAWTWYVNDLIGAQFIGHPMDPQFQQATLHVEDKSHPASAGLPDQWVREDEWYSFAASPRREGYHVLATIDEGTYAQVGMFGADVAMNGDHPMIWWHCQGNGPRQGRAFYSALGHKAEYYAEPRHMAMLLGATRWALRLEGEGCDLPAPANTDINQTGE